MTKIKSPQLPTESLEARDLTSLIFVPDDEWRNLHLSGLARGDATHGRFEEIEWLDARLGGAVWNSASWNDCRFEICDLAGAQSAKIAVTRAQFDECRLRGMLAGESDWCDVIFRNCNLSRAVFRHSRWKRARFENCDLTNSDWGGADARGVVFQNCDLREADFNFCQLQSADWRGCQTEGLAIDAKSLRGLIVEPMQAAQFARVLGLDVRWD